VARRAGVAAATAYTYFSSKDHLLAEVLWRRMDGLPPFDPAAHPDRFEALRDAVTPVVVFAAERPAVVDAVTAALVSRNPDVRHLRDRIGAVIHRRMTAALGPAVDPAVVQLLWTAYNGALLTAGIGHAPFEDVPGFVVGAARMLLEPAAGRPARTGGR
jgi:AcrR family transcriptional regulator